MSSLVFVLVAITGGAGMVAATGYMAAFANTLMLFIYMPILLLVFGIIAYARKDWVFLGYPLVVFFFAGPILIESYAAKAIGSQLPFLLRGDSNAALIGILLAYGFLFTLEWSVSRLARRGRFKELPPSKATDATSYFIIGCAVILAVALPFFSKSIMQRVAYERAAFRAPQTKDLSTVLVGSKEQALDVRYAEATEQQGGSYRMTDHVAIWPIKQGKSRKTRDACGTSITVLEQRGVMQYQKTASGFEYGTAAIPVVSSSDPSRKTRQFIDYRICFVLDNKMYILERDDRYGDDYLKRYPADLVVDAFYKAKRVTSTPPLPSIEPFTYDKGVVGINPSAYETKGYLDVPEWGIRVPLTTMTKDAYYVKTSKPDWLRGGLRSKTDSLCAANQTRADSEGGLFTIIRSSKAEVQATKEKYKTDFPTPHKTIGDYLYALSPNGFTNKRCFPNTEEVSVFQDILDWATVNIKPL